MRTTKASNFLVIQGSPCWPRLAPYIAIVVNDAHATVNSIYRGTDAAAILNAHGKHTQAQLYELYLEGKGAPANPPGYSTHEARSDGVAYNVVRGAKLGWWQIGFDVNDADVPHVMAQAAAHKWKLFQPYHSGSEYHHLNFARPPFPTPHTAARIVRLRRSLPNH